MHLRYTEDIPVQQHSQHILVITTFYSISCSFFDILWKSNLIQVPWLSLEDAHWIFSSSRRYKISALGHTVWPRLQWASPSNTWCLLHSPRQSPLVICWSKFHSLDNLSATKAQWIIPLALHKLNAKWEQTIPLKSSSEWSSVSRRRAVRRGRRVWWKSVMKEKLGGEREEKEGSGGWSKRGTQRKERDVLFICSRERYLMASVIPRWKHPIPSELGS